MGESTEVEKKISTVYFRIFVISSFQVLAPEIKCVSNKCAVMTRSDGKNSFLIYFTQF